jgi:hypothetical protein
MSKQLYEEALADVKRLKEVAEDNAKKALIEAVTPRIRDLIENQLLREFEESEEVDKIVGDDGELLLDDGLSDEALTVPPSVPSTTVPSMAAAALDLTGGGVSNVDVANAISMPDEKGEVVLDLDALSQAAVEPALAGVEGEEALPVDASDMFENSKLDVSTGLRILKVEGKVNSLSRYKSNLRKMSGFKNLVAEAKEEVETIYGGIQESSLGARSKKLFEAKLETIYKNVNKLMEQGMNKKNISEDLTFKVSGIEAGEPVDLEDLNVTIEEEEPSEEEGDELDLGGEEGDEDEEVELDLGGEEEGEEESEEDEDEMEEAKLPMESRRLGDNVIVEIDENMLRNEIKRMRDLREAAEDVQSWGHGAGEVSDDFEDDDLGDPFLDVDVTTEGLNEYDMSEMEMQAKDPAAKDKKHSEEDEDLDELAQAYEAHGSDEDEDDMNEMDQARDKPEYGGSDREDSRKRARSPGMTQKEQQVQEETLLRRLAAEQRLQTEAKKKAHKAKKMKEQQAQKGKKAAADAAVAKKKGNSHAAATKQKEARSCQSKAEKLGEAYTFFATKFNESVSRVKRLQAVLAEVRRHEETSNGSSTRLAESADKLRDKLAETNLFNAKLLYSNKLLQNESLTKRQKAEVIQRLDEAKTEREVKLVYESLVKTLSGASRQLSEVAERRVLGSSSQATRSASTPLNEGVELNRWAKLAGIK